MLARGFKMADLILIGGAKGVGKTKIIDALQQSCSLKVINTGHFFLEALDQCSEPETSITDYLINGFNGVVDTHYAGYSKSGFVRGLSPSNLRKVSLVKTIDLILLDLDYNTLLERRLQDNAKRRIYEPELVLKELEANRHYFQEYCRELSKPGLHLYNYNFDQTLNTIMGRIKC